MGCAEHAAAAGLTVCRGLLAPTCVELQHLFTVRVQLLRLPSTESKHAPSWLSLGSLGLAEEITATPAQSASPSSPIMSRTQFTSIPPLLTAYKATQQPLSPRAAA